MLVFVDPWLAVWPADHPLPRAFFTHYAAHFQVGVVPPAEDDRRLALTALAALHARMAMGDDDSAAEWRARMGLGQPPDIPIAHSLGLAQTKAKRALWGPLAAMLTPEVGEVAERFWEGVRARMDATTAADWEQRQAYRMAMGMGDRPFASPVAAATLQGEFDRVDRVRVFKARQAEARKSKREKEPARAQIENEIRKRLSYVMTVECKASLAEWERRLGVSRAYLSRVVPFRLVQEGKKAARSTDVLFSAEVCGKMVGWLEHKAANLGGGGGGEEARGQFARRAAELQGLCKARVDMTKDKGKGKSKGQGQGRRQVTL